MLDGTEVTEARWLGMSVGTAPTWATGLGALVGAEDWRHLVWSLGVAALAILLGCAAAWVLIATFGRWSRHTRTSIDDAVLKHLAQPVRWLLPLTTLTLALPLLSFGEGTLGVVRQVLVVAITLSLGWSFFRAVRVVEEVVGARLALEGATNLEARTSYTQLRGLRNIAGFLIGLITFGLSLLSFGSVRQVGASLLASAGVAGIVIGFAAQRSIATILAGLVIAIAQPIRIDDAIVVEDEFGTVEELTLTYVVVRLWDLRRLVLPINYFLEHPFQNWTRSSTNILATVLLYLDYSLPVEALRGELRRVLDSSEKWDKQTWSLQVTDATDRSIVVRALMSAADAPTAWDLRCEVREKLLGFIQSSCPSALPRQRTEAAQPLGGTGTIAATSAPS